MRLPWGAARIDYHYALSLPLRDRREALSYSSKEGPRLALKAVLVMPARRALGIALIPSACPVHARMRIRIQQDRQLRLQIAAQHSMQFQHRRAPKLPSAALICLGRVGKTIA